MSGSAQTPHPPHAQPSSGLAVSPSPVVPVPRAGPCCPRLAGAGGVRLWDLPGAGVLLRMAQPWALGEKAAARRSRVLDSVLGRAEGSRGVHRDRSIPRCPHSGAGNRPQARFTRTHSPGRLPGTAWPAGRFLGSAWPLGSQGGGGSARRRRGSLGVWVAGSQCPGLRPAESGLERCQRSPKRCPAGPGAPPQLPGSLGWGRYGGLQL